MAAGGQMAEFFATLGFNINKADIKKVDKQLDILEMRARRLSEESLSNIRVNISRFGFSDNFNTRLRKALEARMKVATKQAFNPEVKFAKIHVPVTGIRFSPDFNTKLHNALKNRMRVASTKGISPQIELNKFDVDRQELLREMRDAVRYVEQNLRVNIRSSINRPAVGGAAGGGQAGGGGISRFGAGMGAGAAAGNLGRGFIPGLGVAFGVSQMNRLNQQLIGQDLAATAVFGGEEKGQEQLSWLRDLGNQIGFDYRSQANPYLKMQASAQTAGMDNAVAQDIFQSMAEYGRVMGLDDEAMKGSMRAVEQMLNKGQVYAEELKMQLAERFPAAIQLMAEAVAGGDTEKLMKMMEEGEIRSLEALPKFAKILARQARVGGALTEAMKTSLAEQMRFNNTFNDLVMEFSDAGFEKGQAGIFRTMATFFEEMLPLLRGFGESWKYVEGVLRVPLGLLVDLSTGIEKLSEKIDVSKGAIIGLGTIFSLLLFPLTRTFTIISFGLLLLEDFTAFLTGRGSAIGKFFKKLEETDPEFFKELESLFTNIKELIDTVYTGYEELLNLLMTSFDMPVIDQLKEVVTELNKAIEGVLILSGKKDGESDSLFKVRKGSVMDWVMPDSYPRYGREDIDRSSAGGMLEFYQSIVEGQLGSSVLQGAETAATVGSLGMVNFGDPTKNPYMNDYISFNRESATPQQGGSGSSGISQFFDLKISVDGSNGDRQTAENINNYLQEMLRTASDKAAGASQ